jgi:hypothetical protein
VARNLLAVTVSKIRHRKSKNCTTAGCKNGKYEICYTWRKAPGKLLTVYMSIIR